MGDTADALAHYSVVASNSEILLADLQGLRKGEEKREGHQFYVLFDAMVHT